mmetsp:Transcript_53310/g.129576  ORF Transcript_53310/g.129576 Transcript_53310/m.129576 type:complete len:856 (-) Transcript_53310:79-2646(-)
MSSPTTTTTTTTETTATTSTPTDSFDGDNNEKKMTATATSTNLVVDTGLVNGAVDVAGAAGADAVTTADFGDGEENNTAADHIDTAFSSASATSAAAAAAVSATCGDGGGSDAASAFFTMDYNKALGGLGIPNKRGGSEETDDTTASGSTSTTTGGRYFEPSDFLPQQNWEYLTDQFDKNNMGPLGLAVVATAGSVVCFHPLVIVAGVVTALGTFQAAAAGHDWCNSSSSGSGGLSSDRAATLPLPSPTATAAASAEQGNRKEGNRNDHTVDLDSAFCHCFPISFSGTTTTTQPSDAQATGHDANKQVHNGLQQQQQSIDDYQNDTTSSSRASNGKVYTYRQMSQITFSDDSIMYPPVITTTPTTAATKENSTRLSSSQQPPLNESKSHVQPSSIQIESQHTTESQNNSTPNRTQMDVKSSLEFVQQFYPTLGVQSSVQNVEFHGLNAKEFFDVFFADDAPFGFEAFHKARKDKDVEYGQWETLEDVLKPCLLPTAPSVSSKSSTHSATATIPPIQERVVTYQAKTNSMFGPPFAPTTKIQRAMQVSKKMLMLEIKTTLADIPFADRFYLMERWVVTSEKETDKKNKGTTPTKKSSRSTSCACLSVTSQVFFTQSCPFESTVHKESAKQINQICKQWNEMAQEALKRTEETRRQRLEDEKVENLNDDDEDSIDDTEDGTTSSSDGDQTVPTSYPPTSDGEIEIEHVSRQKSWVVGDAQPVVIDAEYDDNPINPIKALASILTDPVAPPSTSSSSAPSSWRSSFQRRTSSKSINTNNDKMGGSERIGPHRRLSRPFSNMMRNRTSSSDLVQSNSSNNDGSKSKTLSTPNYTQLQDESSLPVLEILGLNLDDCSSAH